MMTECSDQDEEEDVTDLSAFHVTCLNVFHSEHYDYNERPASIRELVKYLDPKYQITYGMVMRYCGYECTEE